MTRAPSGPRDPAPASIDQGEFVSIHGVDQWVTIRGRDRRNLVLMIIGGAGAALSSLAAFYAPWEERFTLVQWDQPFSGATYARNGPEPISFARLARDGIAVAEYALAVLGMERLAILAISMGSVTGLRIVRDRPDLVSAYVSCGQVVHWAAQEASAYRMLVAQAAAEGDVASAAELAAIGPPPWSDLASVAVKGRLANRPTAKEAGALRAAFAAAAPGSGPDVQAVAMAAFTAIWEELKGFDARELATAFEVPMTFIQGELDAHIPTPEVEAYAVEIDAPAKEVVRIEGAGHLASFLRDELLVLLDRHAWP